MSRYYKASDDIIVDLEDMRPPYEKFHKKIALFIFYALLFIALGIVSFLVGFFLLEIIGVASMLLGVGFLFTSFSYVKELSQLKRNFSALRARYQAELAAAAAKREAPETIYAIATKANIQSLDSPADIERFKLLLTENGYEGSPTPYIEKYREAQKKDIKQKETAAKKAKNKEEKDAYQKNTRHLSKHGREKVTAYYNDIIREYNQRLTALKQEYEANIARTNYIIENGATPEKDWGTPGGVVSTLVSPVAGLATALSIQQENQKIRSTNEARMRSAVQAKVFFDMDYANTKESIEKEMQPYRDALKKAKLLLVDDTVSQKDLLERMKPEAHNITKIDAHSHTVDIKCQRITNTIFESVTAIVDGSFNVILTDKRSNEVLATVALCLPEIVDSRKSLTLRGYGKLAKACPTDQIAVTFAPRDLWLIEMLRLP